jgi:succinate dehydrogenase/fumarate reductase flavoprotein subunit
MEDTTRDVASIAQTIEILEDRGGPHGGIFVSYRHLPPELVDYSAEWQPWWRGYKYGGFDLKEFGFDLKDKGFEAAPASHYWNGGIRINEEAATNIPGLYAAGEIIGGNMGANRLSGNAVTECVVWAPEPADTRQSTQRREIVAISRFERSRSITLP